MCRSVSVQGDESTRFHKSCPTKRHVSEIHLMECVFTDFSENKTLFQKTFRYCPNEIGVSRLGWYSIEMN